MKRPLPVTHMPLQTYASYMGINPLHFQGATVSGFFQNMGHCNSVWYRHTWQSVDNVSHEDLALQIRDAEETIRKFLGYNVAPEWQVIEMAYPKSKKKNTPYMRDRSYRYRSVVLQRGEVISGGVRGTEFLGTIDVTYVDQDGDDLEETAVIDIGQEYDWREIGVFFPDTGGDRRWEIRPIREIKDNVIYMDAWLFIDPEKQSRIPTTGVEPINIDNGANLVETVDIYRVYNNVDVPSCTFIWDAEGITQDGYLHLVDPSAGIVRPTPAVYQSGVACTTVTPANFCVGREPDRVKMNVYSGKRSDDFLNGYSLDPLDHMYEESIRLLATARLNRDLCGCNNIIAIGKDLRVDMALISPQGNFLAVADKIQECPFGTRRGEWLAWNRLVEEPDKYFTVATV